MSSRKNKFHKPKKNNPVQEKNVPPPSPAQNPPNFLRSDTSWAGLFESDIQKESKRQKKIMLKELVQERQLKQQELAELDALEALALRTNKPPDPFQAVMNSLEIMKKNQQDREEARKIAKKMTEDLQALNIRATNLESLLRLRFNAQSVVVEPSNTQYQLK